MNKTRLAIVVSHPIQHFVHFYRAIHQCSDIELRVLYATDIGARQYFDEEMNQQIRWDIDMLGGYPSRILPDGTNITKTGFFEINNPSITKELNDFSPDVVMIHGYSQITLIRTMLWSLAHRVPILLWSDSSLTRRRSLIRRFLKQLLLRPVLSLISGVLVIGHNNKHYYLNYGVPIDRIFKVPFTIDQELFHKARDQRQTIGKQIRSKYHIPDNAFVFLYVGKLTRGKRPQDLVEASILLKSTMDSNRPICVLFAGNGDLLADLQDKVTQNSAPCLLPGFINVLELPDVYAAADVLVHPSENEAYGLVIREAACIGLPIIVSDQVGAVSEGDVASPGRNAIVYRSGNVQELVQAMTTLYKDNRLYNEYSNASLEISEDLVMDKSIEGLRQAFAHVCR